MQWKRIAAGGCGCIALVVVALVGIGLAFGSRATPPQAATASPTTAVSPTLPVAAKEPTSAPPATTAPAPTLVPTEPPAAERVRITGAGPGGVNLRSEPSTTAARIKGLVDGAEVEVAGTDRQEGGRTWRNVRDPSDGATGWVAGDFLATIEGAPGVAVAPSAPSNKPAGSAPEAQAYLSWLQPKLDMVAQASSIMSGQLRQFNETPTIFLDQQWRLKTGVGLGLLKVAGQQMQSEPRNVPASATALDVDVKALGADLVGAADDYIAGLDAMDARRFSRGNERMQAASERVNRMKPQIEALNKGVVESPAAPAAGPKPTAPAPAPSGGTIVCKDGYVWPGTTRQGACNGHGGIR